MGDVWERCVVHHQLPKPSVPGGAGQVVCREGCGRGAAKCGKGVQMVGGRERSVKICGRTATPHVYGSDMCSQTVLCGSGTLWSLLPARATRGALCLQRIPHPWPTCWQ